MAHPQAQKPLKVVFVPGFLSEVYKAVSLNLEAEINGALKDAARRRLNYDVKGLRGKVLYHVDLGDRVAARINIRVIPSGGLISFHTQMADLTADHVDYYDMTEAPSFNSAESVEANARAISDYLSTVTESDVVIVSHSKGGLDTLHALITNRQLVSRPVVGWVALQAPFFGSPIAEAHPPVADLILKGLGGSGQALADLAPTTRGPYMTERATDIADIIGAIPVLSCYSTYEAAPLSSWVSYARSVFDGSLAREIVALVGRNIKRDPRHIIDALVKSTAEAMKLVDQKVASTLSEALSRVGMMDSVNVAMNKMQLPNDGLVPVACAKLPGSELVELADGDHAAPVMITEPLKECWTTDQRNAVTRDLIERVTPVSAA